MFVSVGHIVFCSLKFKHNGLEDVFFLFLSAYLCLWDFQHSFEVLANRVKSLSTYPVHRDLTLLTCGCGASSIYLKPWPTE